jgi:uncharacterized metal-binding protein
MSCVDLVFGTANNMMPSDTRPDLILEMTGPVRIILYILFAFIVLETGICGGVMYAYRDTIDFKNSQITMMSIMLFSFLLAAGKVLVAALELSNATCISGLWMGHMAFACYICALYLKSWRLHKLFNAKGIKRASITERDVATKWLVGVFCVVLYLILLTLVGKPYFSSSDTEADNQTTRDLYCKLDYSEFHTTLFVVEGVFVLMTAYMCYQIRFIPKKFNDFIPNSASE